MGEVRGQRDLRGLLKLAKLQPRQDLTHLIHGKSTMISGRSSTVDFPPSQSLIIASVKPISDACTAILEAVLRAKLRRTEGIVISCRFIS